MVLIRPRLAGFEVTGDIVAGLSSQRGHQFLEADEVQHTFEVVGQGGQTPFAADLRQTLG
jgi:hypothetical protein